MTLTHPWYLLLLIPGLLWVGWFGWKTDAQLSPWRRWAALALRTIVLMALVFAMAGLQWRRPVEGMNVLYVLDRSDSIPSSQQETARNYVNQSAAKKDKADQAGVIVFGTDASIESLPNPALNLQKVQAVVGTERTDLAAAIRLGTAAFPETGQKRLVLLTDGNENLGDAMGAVLAAKQLGVSVDALPMGVARGQDVAVQKVQIPPQLKKGQAFDVKIFVQSDRDRPATARLYRNEQFLGEQPVQLSAGKNLFTFPQTIADPGFYTYDVRIDAAGDPLPQNNRASGFASIQGDPRILIVSSDAGQDATLAAALRTFRLDVRVLGVEAFPSTLAEMQSYDSIFLCNVAAGDLGRDRQKLLESAVRDFGVGIVCIGGDQAFAAGGYRGTPLETLLPISMELDSKKVLPSGAVVLVMHGMEFNNGNQVARDCAQGVLAALGPQDELGVILWDGSERWLFELQKVGDKRKLQSEIAGMNQGDLGSFQNILSLSHQALKKSTANLKHIIVFSDGDPGRPTQELMDTIVNDRITVSTVLIAGHFGPDHMIFMADAGRGRFYNVTSVNDLPQIFIKETAVILKSAIYEEPFKPQLRASSELIRGIAPDSYPQLLGYVASTPKPRAETPLVTHQGDPLLAHWQYGLGRTVAFTSDAKSRWARPWLGWENYAQFWSQTAQWSLRRLENAELEAEATVERGEGLVQVEALDPNGEYRNFLNLQAAVVAPSGEQQTVRLEQTGPGHYEARFPTKEVGSYLLNVMEIQGGRVRASRVIGASINYSPEFASPEPNVSLLHRLTELGGGKILDPADHPFGHNRVKTFQPRDLWPLLLQIALILFVLDIGVRRVQIDREEWLRATATFRKKRPAPTEESLSALLNRRKEVRAQQPTATEAPAESLFQPAKTPPPPAPTPVSPPIHPAPHDVSQPPPPPTSTTSKLLEAKKRTQRRQS